MQPRLGFAAQDSRVREVQTLLTELSYLPGPIDGILGPQTLNALHDFQRANGLELVDNIDLTTLRQLRAARNGSYGATRSAIPRRVSRALLPNREPEASRNSKVELPSLTTDASLVSRTRAPEPDTVISAGQAVGLFALAAVTGTLVLGVLGFFGVVCSLGQRTPATLLHRAWSLAANQADVYRHALGNRALWHRFNRSFLGQMVAKHLGKVASSKQLRAAARQLKLFTWRRVKSRRWQRSTESLRHRHDAPSASEPRSQHITPSRDRLATAAAEPRLGAKIAKTSEFAPHAFQRAARENRTNELGAARETRVRKRSSVEDPLAALSVHLAFERFHEAEELAKHAVEQCPERPEYRLRLLQVYHEAGNRVGFEYHARALCATVGSTNPVMDMVAAWWHDLAPNEALFPTPESQISGTVEPVEQEGGDNQGAIRDRE